MQKLSTVLTATGGSRASQDTKSRTSAQEITFQELKTFRADGKRKFAFIQFFQI